ncbi:MAG: ABC transporter substrate-binding protein [Candidatus Bathyarchaeia archaeon]
MEMDLSFSKAAITRLQAIIIAIIVVVAVIGAVVYFLLLPPPTQTVEELTELRLGAVLPLSGTQALPGTRGLIGMQIAVDWLNAKGGINWHGRKIPVRLIYYDDEGKDEYTSKLTEKLILEDKVYALCAHGMNSRVIVPITEKYRIVAAGGTSGPWEAYQGYKYYFIACGQGDPFINTLQLIRKKDPTVKTIAWVIGAGMDPAGIYSKQLEEFTKQYGYELVCYLEVPMDITDAAPLLAQMAAYKPDIMAFYVGPPIGFLASGQLRDTRVWAKYILVLGGASDPFFGQNFNKWAVGIVSQVPYDDNLKFEVIAASEGKEFVGPTTKEINEAWKAKKDPKDPERTPEDVGRPAMVPIIVAELIERTQSLDPDKIAEVAKTVDFYTSCGRYKLDPNNFYINVGQPYWPAIIQWQKKDNMLRLELVGPEEFATSTLIQMPTWEEKEKWPELIFVP